MTKLCHTPNRNPYNNSYMTTKECKECGPQPISQFNTDTNGKPKGALCKICNNKLRAERSAAKRGPVEKDEERDTILEKYKDNPTERKKALDNLKAKRFRKRLQEKNKGKLPDQNIKTKSCMGNICKGKLLPVEKFSKDSTKVDGYQVRCKDCAKFISDKNKEKHENVDINSTTKICSSGKLGCGKNLSLNKYDVSNNGKYGRHNLCNNCRKDQRKDLIYVTKKTGTKKCSFCNTTKSVSNFYADIRNPPDGLHSSCIPCHREASRKSYSTHSGFLGKILNDSRSNAKKKKLQHNITKENLAALCIKQNGLCALTGEKMTHTQLKTREDSDEHILNPTNMSIDRINSSIGYIPSNIQLVCASVNKIKHNMTQRELVDLCTNIQLHKVDKKYNELSETEPIKISNDVKSTIQKKLSYTKGNAKSRKYKVNITDEDICNQYIKQNGLCAISGIKLQCDKKSNDLSIDRIDSQIDYNPGNIHLTSNVINVIKSDANVEDFNVWINKIKPEFCLF